MEDFSSVEKIDAHYHINVSKSISIQQAKRDNFKLHSINTNSGSCGNIVETHQWLKSIKAQSSDDLNFSTTFCLDGWDEPNWAANTIEWIDKFH